MRCRATGARWMRLDQPRFGPSAATVAIAESNEVEHRFLSGRLLLLVAGQDGQDQRLAAASPGVAGVHVVLRYVTSSSLSRPMCELRVGAAANRFPRQNAERISPRSTACMHAIVSRPGDSGASRSGSVRDCRDLLLRFGTTPTEPMPCTLNGRESAAARLAGGRPCRNNARLMMARTLATPCS